MPPRFTSRSIATCLPLILIGVYAFNESITQRWPIQEFSAKWFSAAYHDPFVRDALWLSVQAALGATAVALVLGTLLSIAVSRFRFFGRDAVPLIVILPIALPGIITGLALQTTYSTVGIDYGLVTIISGTPRSASSSSTTTPSLASVAWRDRWRRRRPISGRTLADVQVRNVPGVENGAAGGGAAGLRALLG